MVSNSSLPGTANVTCVTTPITSDSLLTSQLLTVFVGASQSGSASLSTLGQAGSSVQALSDVFDSKDEGYLQNIAALFEAASAAGSSELANLAVSRNATSSQKIF
jgi:hypothetical protein